MAENKNMELYDFFCTPPNGVLKPIDYGPLKGKSDINPQWRYEALTQKLGPCGIGWKFTVDNYFTQEIPQTGETMLFVMVSLYIRQGDEWSDGIPAYGGDFLIKKDKNGIHGNDEAMKMAITDALGTACKYIGVAADVYRGLLNGVNVGADTKYSKRAENAQNGAQATEKKNKGKSTNKDNKPLYNEADAVRKANINKLNAEIKRLKLSKEEAIRIAYSQFKKNSVKDMSDTEICVLTEKLEKWADELHTATTWGEDAGVPNQ